MFLILQFYAFGTKFCDSDAKFNKKVLFLRRIMKKIETNR